MGTSDSHEDRHDSSLLISGFADNAERSSKQHTQQVMLRIEQQPRRVTRAEEDLAEQYAIKEAERRSRAEVQRKRYVPLSRPVLSQKALAAARAGPGPRGALSAMDVLPYCDKFKAATLDVMHVVLLGRSFHGFCSSN